MMTSTTIDYSIPLLREKLAMAIGEDRSLGLLFSGGLDSSILAFCKSGLVAITVSLESSGEDLTYVDYLASELSLIHYRRIVKIEEAVLSIPDVIKISKSFDPVLPNDLVIYFS